MMKRILLVAACAGLWFTFGGASPASADNGPHVAGAGIVADGCASCHRTHTAKAGKLLKQAQPALCYSCHGSTGTGAATDVVAGTGYATKLRPALPGALRGGGFTTARIDSSKPSGQEAGFGNSAGVVPALAAGTAVTSTHSVDNSPQTAWGSGINGTVTPGKAGVLLTCGSCHDPHGNGNFRILKGKPVGSDILAANAVNIVEPVATAKVYTTTNYWAQDAANNTGFITNVSAWCTTCHTRYLSTSGRAVNADPTFTYRHTSADTTAGGPNCILCHVSHGSNATMTAVANAVEMPGAVEGTVRTGSNLLRIDNKGTCQMCHNR